MDTFLVKYKDQEYVGLYFISLLFILESIYYIFDHIYFKDK